MKLPVLCQPCEDALRKGIHEAKHRLSNYVGAQKTVESLIAASDLGCVICSVLWRSLPPHQQAVVASGHYPYRQGVTKLRVEAAADLQMDGYWNLFAHVDGVALRELSIHVVRSHTFVLSPEAQVAEHYNTAPASTSSRSTETLKIVLNWVEECCSAHVECSSTTQPSWMPTRLLDTSKFSSEGIVQLVESASLDQHHPYCTLSHRWGTSCRAKLTKATAPAMALGISIEALPPTFQHAIEICQRLCIRYLWIDSLCIYQDHDDKSDWLKEGLRMDQVFTNTFLTIAAAAAMDDSEGLFVDRNAEHELRAPTISLPSPTTANVKDFVIVDRDFMDRSLDNAPLNRRGWVFQERVLAPRTLYFGAAQVYWECRRGRLCEKWPENLPDCVADYEGSRTLKGLRPDNAEIDADPDDAPFDSFYSKASGLWTKYISAYSKTSLTFRGDRVIAFSGIAKVMAALYKEEYVAGMWRNHLSSHLLWVVDGADQVDGTPSLRASPWRAPTWSWLSIEGCISLSYHEAKLLDVVDVQVECETSDPTGPILNASLTLRARLRSLRLVSPLKDVWNMVYDSQDFESVDVCPIVQLDVKQDNFDEENREGALFAIPADILTAETRISNYLLVKCVDPQRAIYHRIGIAFCILRQETRWIAEFLAFGHDENEATIPCIAYDPQDRVHTIILK